ncbi:50S ribosomal protein 6, chloroplastic [Phalaenopsis equestris]|uniref:50S ribosomal protein 6, chloroplastic n=1 Tax=Phalaenopsis equestris TaxID=78828 RepID=UPI0009E62330|nr:50S ribosomal protein 6, chloroplastic [Phalaenopsis equestris]
MASLISAASVGILPASFREGKRPPATWSRGSGGGGGPMTVECSSRPKKKGTAHHMKTRPKKTQPWDVKRKGPTLYPVLPLLPPDWTLAMSDDGGEDTVTPGEQRQLKPVSVSTASAVSF